MPKMTRLAVFLAGGIVVVIVIVAALWWFMGRQRARTELSLYGNVDLRQVELPFNGSERIAAVLVQEGDHVKQGQLLAQLETSRLAPQAAKAEADVADRRKSRRPAPMWTPRPPMPPMRGRNMNGCARCPTVLPVGRSVARTWMRPKPRSIMPTQSLR